MSSTKVESMILLTVVMIIGFPFYLLGMIAHAIALGAVTGWNDAIFSRNNHGKK